MNSLPYAVIIGIVFSAGIFVFTYFETPRKTFNKGMRKLRNIRFIDQKNNKTFTIPNRGKKINATGIKDAERDLRVYVYEY